MIARALGEHHAANPIIPASASTLEYPAAPHATLARALGEALAANPIIPVMPSPQPYPVAPHATLQRAETPLPITGPFPRAPVTGPFGKAPMTSPFTRDVPPALARAPRLLLVGAAALLVLGLGLLLAYFV
jgi:hypothetical protein